MKKKEEAEDQALKNILKANIRKFRHRRDWSQFDLAAKIDMSTNFLADIEAGNTWVSALTLIKLANAFEIEVYELLKPAKKAPAIDEQEEIAGSKVIIDNFSKDLAIVLKNSIDKSIDKIKKHYSGS